MFGDNISSSYYVTLQNHVLWNVKNPMHVQAIKLSLIFHCHEWVNLLILLRIFNLTKGSKSQALEKVWLFSVPLHSVLILSHHFYL